MLQPDARQWSQPAGSTPRRGRFTDPNADSSALSSPASDVARRSGSSAGLPSLPFVVETLPGNPNAAADLAMVAAEPVEAGDQYLVFTLLGQEFALKAEHIEGVERLADVTPVPNVASWVSGVINLRGSIASVVDLRAFLGLERLPYNPRTRLLSVECNEMVICLVVDSVSDMLPIAPSTIAAVSRQNNVPYWIAPYAVGSVNLGKRAIVILDAARLLFSEKMQHYS
ncbi:MAG TPA: chemotaxis protein CheW [Ktedonobacteraceae bacterium]|nr:chemotaxis protein CheW [Ktedonobacteraceae bacterium]